jgi:hypothetical protein
MALETSLPRESLALFAHPGFEMGDQRGAQLLMDDTPLDRAPRPLIEQSISNGASMRRTASSADGEMSGADWPSALRRALWAISASAKNGRHACSQQAASMIGTALRSVSYSLSPYAQRNLG